MKELKNRNLIILLLFKKAIKRILLFFLIFNLLGTKSPPQTVIEKGNGISFLLKQSASFQQEMDDLKTKKAEINDLFDKIIIESVELEDLKDLLDSHKDYIIGTLPLFLLYKDIKKYKRGIGEIEKQQINDARADTNKKIDIAIDSRNKKIDFHTKEIARISQKTYSLSSNSCQKTFSD